MTDGLVPLAIDAAVALLLAAVIVYAVRLNRRLDRLREGQAELSQLIARFDAAAAHAERSVARMGEAAADQGRALGASIGEAQALRDELAFMIERGDVLVERLGAAPPRAAHSGGAASRSVVRRERVTTPADEAAALGPHASETEEALRRAIEAVRTGTGG
jgi:hypothetical protein